jgi:hypothetical protein
MPNSDALYMALKREVVKQIKELRLTGDVSGVTLLDKVYDPMVVDKSAVEYPCVIVTSEGEREDIAPGGTTELEFWWYPLWVILCDEESQRDGSREGDYQAWRYKIWRRFNNRRPTFTLPSPWSANWGLVTPDAVMPGLRNIQAYQNIVSPMHIKFQILEPRLP